MVSVWSVLVALTILSMDLRISQARPHVTLNEQSIVDYHQQWMTQFSRVYQDESEKEMRLQVFKKNLKFIENFNNMGNQSYTVGVNEFTDWTTEEFLVTHTGLRVNVTSLFNETMPSRNWNISDIDIDDESKDWREEGAVTPVKVQGACGSCWAFSAIGAMEGLTKISGKNLLTLSEQQLIDCDTEKNTGCDGGGIEEAFKYIIKNGGVSLETEYPYQVKKGSCRANARPATQTQIRGFEMVPSHNERGVYAGLDCGTDVNHAVTFVGYGTMSGLNYWVLKNSWGESWGENGYMRIRRDVEWPQGMCGIAQVAAYPIP
ncbi:Cathepsin propeptide inhibitor domain (I29) [Arabidopsis thaliana x Arabidopsis arenosa]|uniref:Cathepsin propeptide inhibitor domain (I29) n=1 Tax=Arabidopsis thaliana x Arabidopsis arenosa TaxID=1240361 RepID=A0A8T2C4T2_9BRAS|nr:Cathepsin propeptide inhibitor domain (I29) [Arabidopsis thaliana x Arabidopsis arenosa]